MMGRRSAASRLAIALLVTGNCAALAQPPSRDMPRYEASQRPRMALEAGCLPNEVNRGAWCVKKCQADFRLDLAARPPTCVGVKAEAKYVPPRPEYIPPKAPPKGAAGS